MIVLVGEQSLVEGGFWETVVDEFCGLRVDEGDHVWLDPDDVAVFLEEGLDGDGCIRKVWSVPMGGGGWVALPCLN